MPKFSKYNANELKTFLYNSFCHDAKLEEFNYDYIENSIKTILFNSFFNVKVEIVFHNIEIALTIKGDWSGSRDTISSLTVEDDFSDLQNYVFKRSEDLSDSLYLLFQMFSGEELHIVSKEVIAEILR